MKFGSFAELNAWLGDRCQALWDEVRHPEHDRFSVAEMLDNEWPHLMPMPEPFDGYVENAARVSSTCLVVVARNRYSVPCELAGHALSTRLYPGKIVIVADDAVVASHERLSDRGQTQYNWQHYIPLIQRKPGARVRRGPFVAQETVRRSWICPSRCSSCDGPCCAIRVATASWPRCWPSCRRWVLTPCWWRWN